jgi:hypothetical protein
MMSVGNHLTVLVQDPGCGASMRSSGHIRVLRRPDMSVAEKALNIFVIVVASALPKVGAFVREANKRHHLKALLVHADLDERWIGQLLDRAQVRTLSNLLVYRGNEQPGRILAAWRSGGQDKLIADAIALPDRLLVISCALERIEVPFNRVRCLSQMAPEERLEFEIDVDGSYLYWPKTDVHLDLDSLRFAIDKTARDRARLDAIRSNQRIGAAIASLRKSAGLSTNSVNGVSDRQMRRIEQGQSVPRTATMEKLASTHGMVLSEYLTSLAAAIRNVGG